VDPTLHENVLAAQAGDRDAFAYLVTALGAAAHQVARGVTRDRHLAEDAVQEAFVVALKRLTQLERPEAFPGWLLTIVYTTAVKQGRRKRPDLLGDAPLPPADGEDPPGERADRAEAEALVRSAVRRMPDRERQVLERFYLEGRSVAETAAELALPTGTIKRRLHEARDRLRPRLLGLAPARGAGRSQPTSRRGLRRPL